MLNILGHIVCIVKDRSRPWRQPPLVPCVWNDVAHVVPHGKHMIVLWKRLCKSSFVVRRTPGVILKQTQNIWDCSLVQRSVRFGIPQRHKVGAIIPDAIVVAIQVYKVGHLSVDDINITPPKIVVFGNAEVENIMVCDFEIAYFVGKGFNQRRLDVFTKFSDKEVPQFLIPRMPSKFLRVDRAQSTAKHSYRSL